MENYIWIVQVLLALFFLVPGLMKIYSTKVQLVQQGSMSPNQSMTFIRVLGSSELLGCVAMIVPLWYPSLLVFTMLAALGFCIVMIGAIPFHVKKKEFKKIPILTIALLFSLLVFSIHFNKLVLL
ncbi:MAG: DoxX family protein [Balneolaceae bacterium]